MSNPKRHPQADLAIAIEQGWKDAGKFIEGGYQAFLVLSGMTVASPEQKTVMRRIWMLSAQHMLGSVMGNLTPGTDPSVADIERFRVIATELRDFEVEVGIRKPEVLPGRRPDS